jgi:hypothetical protein
MKLFQFLVAVFLLVSSVVVLADKPDPNVPNPPLQVQEYNVDADGYIAVHEQGTAKVDIQNSELDVHVNGGDINATVTGGSVTVDNTDTNPVPVTVENLPSEQDVYVNGGEMSVVTTVYTGQFSIASGDPAVEHTFSGGPIYATTIHAADGDDETYIEFYSPLAGDKVFAFWDPSGDFIEHTHSFTYPIPINGYRAYCANESESCGFRITVIGF